MYEEKGIIMDKIDLKSCTYKEVEALIRTIGEKTFRTKQVYEWLHKKLVNSFDEMTNISKDLRLKLDEFSYITPIETLEKNVSDEDSTIKYLFKLEKDTIIESVLMRYNYGNTVCVSTQAGCRMGCSFCASTLGGLDRNLKASEILSQIYEIQKDIGERISNIVLMGCGEPLDNYENVFTFINLINSKEGLDIGQRHITISTCGLTDKIEMLMAEKLQVTLAVSLHAPNDFIRSRLMPIAKSISIQELLKVCKQYAEKTGRRVSYEYAMISGVNDSFENATELGKKLRHSLCHVNLIPINEVKERNYKKSSKETTEQFADTLRSYGIETTIRRKLGSDINAACGQLRNSRIDDEV